MMTTITDRPTRERRPNLTGKEIDRIIQLRKLGMRPMHIVEVVKQEGTDIGQERVTQTFARHVKHSNQYPLLSKYESELLKEQQMQSFRRRQENKLREAGFVVKSSRDEKVVTAEDIQIKPDKPELPANVAGEDALLLAILKEQERTNKLLEKIAGVFA